MAQAATAPIARINAQTYVLQFGIVFLLILTLPLDRYYYQQLGAIKIFHLHFQDLFQLANPIPFLGHAGQWGFRSFTGWGWALGLALVLSLVWSYYDNRFARREAVWYYALRVLLRYRLAAALLSYGFLLAFPVQAPYPALSDLHTKYGFFLPWRIYYDSLAVSSAGYGPTLGFIEIVAGILLLFRRTSLFGAGLAAFVLINIVLANFAYQLGDHVISIYLLLAAILLIAYDTPRLYQLLWRERTTRADAFEPSFPGKWKPARIALKTLFAIYFLGYAWLFLAGRSDSWPFPQTPGLKDAAGFYDVRQFQLNGVSHPYSATDSLRWEDVVFEKWNTISVNVHHPVTPAEARPAIIFQPTALQRTFEGLGNGQRVFYSYETIGNHLVLTNKNDVTDILDLDLTRPSKDIILLDGKDHAGNRLSLQLQRVDKKYLLHLGRRHPVKVY